MINFSLSVLKGGGGLAVFSRKMQAEAGTLYSYILILILYTRRWLWVLFSLCVQSYSLLRFVSTAVAHSCLRSHHRSGLIDAFLAASCVCCWRGCCFCRGDRWTLVCVLWWQAPVCIQHSSVYSTVFSEQRDTIYSAMRCNLPHHLALLTVVCPTGAGIDFRGVM